MSYSDESNEHYGYGILNIHENMLVSDENGKNIFSKSEVLEQFDKVQNNLDSVMHLRVVRVSLDNELDEKAVKS